MGTLWQNGVKLLGRLHHPARGKPARHKKLAVYNRFQTAKAPPCGEGAPPMGCAAAPKPATSVYLVERGEAIGAALPPSAGQARSPQERPVVGSPLSLQARLITAMGLMTSGQE